MTKLKSETIRYDQLGGESGNLLDDLKAWVDFFFENTRRSVGTRPRVRLTSFMDPDFKMTGLIPGKMGVKTYN